MSAYLHTVHLLGLARTLLTRSLRPPPQLTLATPQIHIPKTQKQIFPEIKLHGLVPNSYIHVSVSDLYIPTICLPIRLQENRWTDSENTVYKSL